MDDLLNPVGKDVLAELGFIGKVDDHLFWSDGTDLMCGVTFPRMTGPETIQRLTPCCKASRVDLPPQQGSRSSQQMRTLASTKRMTVMEFVAGEVVLSPQSKSQATKFRAKFLLLAG